MKQGIGKYKEEELFIIYLSLIFRAVQEILNHIFIEMYNQQDTDERCFSDSLAELPDHNVVDGKKVRALNLDLIKRRLDRGKFRSDLKKNCLKAFNNSWTSL